MESVEFPAIAISTNDCRSSCIKHDNGGGPAEYDRTGVIGG